MGMMRAILAKVQRLGKQVGRASNHSLADMGRRATVAEFSDQLFEKKGQFSVDLIRNSKLQGVVIRPQSLKLIFTVLLKLSWGTEAGSNTLKLVRTAGSRKRRSISLQITKQYQHANDSALPFSSSVSSPSSARYFSGQYCCRRS